MSHTWDMTKSTLNTKALQSATVGFLAAALVVGSITLGPGISQAVGGDALAASSTARATFSVAKVGVKVAKLDTQAVRATPAATNSNYAVINVTEVRGDENQNESDSKDN